MKLVFILFCIGTAVATELKWIHQENGEDVSDIQSDVIALLTGLGSEDLSHHEHHDFPYSDSKYYREPQALTKFLNAWEQGFITKDSVFSLYSYKNRHDTYRLFDIFYFAKDYDTFIKLAKWGRSELHPLQFAYAFTAAVIHRKDTSGVAIPHLYEVFPHYFVPADIIQGAYKAHILGVTSRKFDVNNTGHEYSWYKEHTMESFKSGPKWNPYDTESRMSYYTEDLGLANFVAKIIMAHAPWISDEKYPDLKMDRKGEILFNEYKYLLKKYNLERYGNNLPQVEPLTFMAPIKTGYNPHLVTIHGHPFIPRPDNFQPAVSNPEGIHSVMITKARYDGVSDLEGYWDTTKGEIQNISDSAEGLNMLANLVYGSSHPTVRRMHKPYHYQIFEALDTAARPSNDLHVTGTVLSNYLTETRDPVFYRVLATVYQVFMNYFSKIQPYTAEELGFPGVKLVEFQTTKLETYFENYEYDITNSVPIKSRGVNSEYKYSISKPRINHKPFTFNFKIYSDKDQDAVIRVYLTPSYDANGRELGIPEKVEHSVGFFMNHMKLKKGVNTFDGDSTKWVYTEGKSMHDIAKLVQKSKSSRNPFYVPKDVRCAFPSNLVLPKGVKGGKAYTIFAIVSPFKQTSNEEYGSCNHGLVYNDDRIIDFPTNRRAVASHFESDNIMFKDVYIYHTEQY